MFIEAIYFQLYLLYKWMHKSFPGMDNHFEAGWAIGVSLGVVLNSLVESFLLYLPWQMVHDTDRGFSTS